MRIAFLVCGWLAAATAVPCFGQGFPQPSGLPLPANAAELDQLLSQKQYLKLGQALQQANDFNSISLNMNWQRLRLQAGASSFVNYGYMFSLFRLGASVPDASLPEEKKSAAELKKTAVVILLYTYELITLDGTKCKDVSAPERHLQTLFKTFGYVLSFAASLSDADVDMVVKAALRMEHLTAPWRGNDDFLCRGGVAELQSGVQKGTVREVPTPPGSVGKTMEVTPDPAYQPEFVDRDIWKPKQDQIRATMPATLAKVVASAKPK